jgi:lysophospholipase L1-like esterase
MLRRTLGLTALCLLATVAASRAQGPASPTLSASRTQVGWISLALTGAPGSTVTVTETTPAGAVPVATVVLPVTGTATIARATPWACAPTTRSFAAVFTDPAGGQQTTGAAIQTPSCVNRLAVLLRPSRPRASRTAAIQIVDRWTLGGVQAGVCSAEPGGGRRRCVTLALAPGQTRAAVQIHPRRPGRHPISVAFAGRTIRRVLLVRPASRRLRVLATGDSMIQIIDGDLQRRLAREGPIRVRSDAHISTGISKAFMLDWVAHARATSRALKPDVTVMFLGANDGFPMGTPSGARAQCCDAAWVREYARRARRMMRSYARNGSGTVYWLLLPAPRSERFARVFRPVNRALRSAATSFPGVVHLIDLGRTFTPGGRFRQTMIWHGRRVSVRQADGVHLSVGGASIATELIVRRMRRDGFVR